MKKFLISMLTLVLILSFVACGVNTETPSGKDGNNTTNPTASQGGNDNMRRDINMAAILSGAGGKTLISDYDEAAKQAFIAEAKADGYDVTFDADGTMRMEDKSNGDVIIQKGDGSWSVEAGGEIGSVDINMGDKWPSNEFTALLPTPTFTIITSNASAGHFGATGTATDDQIKAYVAEVKAKGFTVDERTSDNGSLYSFTANNSNGYLISISKMGETVMFNISKP